MDNAAALTLYCNAYLVLITAITIDVIINTKNKIDRARDQTSRLLHEKRNSKTILTRNMNLSKTS